MTSLVKQVELWESLISFDKNYPQFAQNTEAGFALEQTLHVVGLTVFSYVDFKVASAYKKYIDDSH